MQCERAKQELFPLLYFAKKKEDDPVEFARLARTFEELEQTSSRLTLIELFTQLFRSIE